jgi:TolB-like protein
VPVTEPSHAVFLSYASQDAEAAQRICEALRAAGIEVWFDQSELRGGDAWDQSIRKQIKTCALFVPIISKHTHERAEGYFRLEWKLAVDRSHLITSHKAFLLPAVIDETSEEEEHVPDKFREVQWTRLPGGVTPAAFVERIRRLLSGESAQEPTRTESVAARVSTAPTTPKPVLAFWRSKAALLATSALLVLALGYLAANRLVLSKRGAEVGAAPAPAAQSVPATVFNPPPHSIAVLPFVDMSENQDQEYFGDGMAEEIVNLLVKVPDLKVIGRTSSFQFKGKTDDLQKVGTRLGAAYVVEGSVRRSGDHIRVTAQLIDTRDGTHRWSDTYDREASDILQVQDEIATNLVRALQLEVASSRFIEERVVPRNGEAYDTYLRGLHALNRFDQAGMEEAVAHFRHALTLDPHFVPAAEQLARTLCDQPSWGFVPPSTGYEQARVAADSALKLHPNSAVAHAVLACVHTWYDWDWPAALQEVKTAIALAPNDPFVLVTAAIEREAIGQGTEALSLSEAALSTDPLHAGAHQIRGWAYVYLGRLAEAERAMRRVLEISPTYGTAHHGLGVILLLEGRPQDALSEMQKETPVGGRSAGLALVYHALHRDHDSDVELARLEAEHATDMAMWIAEAHAFRGEKDQAFFWLDRAYSQKAIFLITVKGDPLLKNLERDPRYKAFLRKMNLPE